jgi:hypothetical protein
MIHAEDLYFASFSDSPLQIRAFGYPPKIGKWMKMVSPGFTEVFPETNFPSMKKRRESSNSTEIRLEMTAATSFLSSSGEISVR